LSDVVGPSAFSMHVNEQMNRTEDEDDDDDDDSGSIEVVQIDNDSDDESNDEDNDITLERSNSIMDESIPNNTSQSLPPPQLTPSPVIEPLVISIIETQPQESPRLPNEDFFPSSPVIVNKQPEPTNNPLVEPLDSPNTNTQQEPQPQLFFGDTSPPQSLEQPGIISTQPTLHDEIQKLQFTMEESIRNTKSTSTDQSPSPTTLLEQSKAASKNTFAPPSPRDEVVQPVSQATVDLTSSTSEEDMPRRPATHQITYDGVDDEDSIVKRIKEQDQQIIQQIKQQQETDPEWLKSIAVASGANPSPPVPQRDSGAAETKNTSFGEVLTDAMASVVDNVASVAATLLQPALPPPVAQYHKVEANRNNEEGATVNVITGERQRQDPFEACMSQLFDMGFYDRELNTRMLHKHNNDVSSCVSELVLSVDDQWHNGRHGSRGDGFLA